MDITQQYFRKETRDWKKTVQYIGQKTIQKSGRNLKGLHMHTVAQSYPTIILLYAKMVGYIGAISADSTWYNREGRASSLTIARQTGAVCYGFPTTTLTSEHQSYHWKKLMIYRGHLSQGKKKDYVFVILFHID